MTESDEEKLFGAPPVPPMGFRAELRRQLLARRPGPHRPPNLWLMAGGFGGAGILLLALALILS